MSKKFFFTFSLVLIFIAYIFNVDKTILNKLSILNINIQTSYVSMLVNFQNYISTHTEQADRIKKLKIKVSQNEKYKLLYLKNNKDIPLENNNEYIKTKVISYLNFSDFSKVSLDVNTNTTNISALITKDGYSAGIVIYEDSKYIGLLNHNKKANYAVYIGENLAPGITHGQYNKENITIKYIPIWQDIKVGDEVITSGMDNIFYKGIKVGKVVSIKTLLTTKIAQVKPYANTYGESNFYLYSKPTSNNEK